MTYSSFVVTAFRRPGCLILFLVFSNVWSAGAQSITVSEATGILVTCPEGEHWPNPEENVQQFQFSGTQLTAAITVTAPDRFFLSLTPRGSSNTTLTFEPVNGEVPVTTIYVTAYSHIHASGLVKGTIELTSAGAAPKQVEINGLIIKSRAIGYASFLSFYAGTDTYPIEFEERYQWRSSSSVDIGLGASSGEGTIPSFTAKNDTEYPVYRTIDLESYAPSLIHVFSEGKVYAFESLEEYPYRPYRDPIPFTGNPYGIVTRTDGWRTYVSDNASDKVYAISTASNTALDTITVGQHPKGLATDADYRIYVAHDAGISVIDSYTHEILYTIAIDNPDLMALTPDGKKLYVTAPSKVFVIDTQLRTVIADISIANASAIAMHPEGGRVYIGEFWGRIHVVNTTSSIVEAELMTLSGGSSSLNPLSLALTPEGYYLYAGNGDSGTVSVFSTRNHDEIATVSLYDAPRSLAIAPDGKSVYVITGTQIRCINARTNVLQPQSMMIWSEHEPVLHGNFVTTGGCLSFGGFPIQVYPEGYQGAAVITATPVTGAIAACAGNAGKDSQQKFTVSGRNLSSGITVTAPDNFEIGTAPGDVFGKTVTFPFASATLDDTVVYIRAAPNAPYGAISGRVTLETKDVAKAITLKKSIAVSGTVVNAVGPLIPSITLPVGAVNRPFSTIVGTGVSGFTYSATGLPEGLTIDNEGTISGIPEIATARIPVTVTANGACAQSVSYNIEIEKGFAAVALAVVDVVYDGTPKEVPVATTPHVPVVVVRYNGVTTPPVDAGVYDVVATISSPDYTGSATGRFVISKANQHVTFETLAGKTMGDPDFTLQGSASSGLPVTYTSSNPGVATVSGTTVTIKGAGIANITASQGGNVNYNAATPVVRSLVVNALKTRQEIVFNALVPKRLGDAPFTLDAKASSGLPVSYSSNDLTVAYVVGNKVTIKGPGTVTITATQSGNTSYMAATPVSQTLTVNRGTQQITFGGLPQTVPVGSASLIMGAFSSSGLPVSYTTDHPAVAEVSGRTLTIKGPGWVRITAMQQGNETFDAATPVSRDLYVSRMLQYITFEALPEKYKNDNDFAPAASSTSGLAITFSSNNTKVAVVMNGMIRIVGAGTAVVTATQAGNETYEPAQAVKQTLVVKDKDLITAIEEPEDGTLSLFPNPAAASITMSAGHLAPGKATDIVVSNSHGQVITKQTWNGDSDITLDVSSLQSGVYYICFTEGGKMRYRKFIKL